MPSPFMGRHLFFHDGGAVPPVPVIRQHADEAAPTSYTATFALPCLAGSLILVRQSGSYSLTNPTMAAGAGYAAAATCHATGTGGSAGNSGSAAINYLVAAGGEQTLTRHNVPSFGRMCAYEITAANVALMQVLSVSDAGSSLSSDIGSLVGAGLAFSLHILTTQEAGVHTVSGVTAGDFAEVHDLASSFTSGNPDIPTLWEGNATGLNIASSLHSAVTFTSALPVVNTAGIAVLIPGVSPF